MALRGLGLRGLSLRRAHDTSIEGDRLADFAYLDRDEIYLDAACQSLRPQPVIDAMVSYYTSYNACGGRVKYAWGRRVDEEVGATRAAVLGMFALSPNDYAVSFTLNATYGLNLILQQLPRGRYLRVVTSHIEHNSVFLPTMTAAARLGVDRIVLDRGDDGALVYQPAQLERAIVVVNTTSQIDGRALVNLAQLVKDAHARGGIVVLDAAQTVPHDTALLRKTKADAICFSAHKMYAPSLGVVVARRELLSSLETTFIGGGMVGEVRQDSYDLIPDDPGSSLEPGLQAWAEIIALRHAIAWMSERRPGTLSATDHLAGLAVALYDGLRDIRGLEIMNKSATPVISVHADGQDSHRLAVFLSQSGIMARSGYFCSHHYLKDQLGLPPLLRFSLGRHSTMTDVETTLGVLSRLLKGLA